MGTNMTHLPHVQPVYLKCLPQSHVSLALGPLCLLGILELQHVSSWSYKREMWSGDSKPLLSLHNTHGFDQRWASEPFKDLFLNKPGLRTRERALCIGMHWYYKQCSGECNTNCWGEPLCTPSLDTVFPMCTVDLVRSWPMFCTQQGHQKLLLKHFCGKWNMVLG